MQEISLKASCYFLMENPKFSHKKCKDSSDFDIDQIAMNKNTINEMCFPSLLKSVHPFLAIVVLYLIIVYNVVYPCFLYSIIVCG